MLIQNSRASANLAMLEFVVKKLETLKDEFVFLGGCTTALFITDQAVPDVRSTIDVDCIVDVLSLSEYHRLETKLAKQGFRKSINDGVICRWHYDDMILDVMPASEVILGFGNRWYKEAMRRTITHKLADGLLIKSVTAPYFIATKLEAFDSRGNNDFLMSHDFEDIITIIDGRSELVHEIELSDANLKDYISRRFSEFLKNDDFVSYLPGHLNYGPVTHVRAKMTLERIKTMASFI